VTNRTRPGEAAERLLAKVPRGCRVEDAARVLLDATEDACLVYVQAARGGRLLATAAREPTLHAKLQTCVGQDAPGYVVEAILSGLPRTSVYRQAGHRGGVGITVDDWQVGVLARPRYGLVTSLEPGGVVRGALLMLRCRTACDPYDDFDIDMFRLIGLQVSARFRPSVC